MGTARKALVVGVDYYANISALHGCVNDAHAVKGVLDRHMDGSVNFSVKLMTATGPSERLTRTKIKKAVSDLFSGDSEVALFFFAGHGHIEATGGYLCASDCMSGDDGLSLHDVVVLANNSRAKNRVIVLDSCHAGIAGTKENTQVASAELTEGLTILTASTADQYATEEDGSGVFTTLFVDALSGAAGNLVGDVTPGAVYAHIDQSLGSWDQRPVFKTNVKSFVSLRQVQPPIELGDLQKITGFFPGAGHFFPLDPSYEPTSATANMTNTATFAILQKFNRVSLLVPVDASHMYFAAMNSTGCKLTVLGEHYRRLVARGLI